MILIKMLNEFKRRMNEFSKNFNEEIESTLKRSHSGPGQVPRLVAALSRHARVAGGSPGHIQESTSEYINRWNSKLMFLSPPSSISLKSINKFLRSYSELKNTITKMKNIQEEINNNR